MFIFSILGVSLVWVYEYGYIWFEDGVIFELVVEGECCIPIVLESGQQVCRIDRLVGQH